ncbi:EamA family transporter [Candidatus Giovannonibacteria bacterium]|nr:EamA family transporter [Candidatus Giovannonibacteria bacterium]
MNFFLPVLAAFLQASSFTLDKVILSIKKIDFRTYTGISFPLIFVINLIIFFLIKPPLTYEMIFGKLFWYILASIFLMIIGNIIYYKALGKDKLSEIEVIGLITVLPVIIFSSLIFSDERKLGIIIPALIASLAMIWSHWKGGKFVLKRDTLFFLLLYLVTSPIRTFIIKILLETWNPISLELLHAGVTAAVLTPLYRKSYSAVTLKAFSLLVLTNLLTAVAWILFYFSFQASGIVYTVLLFSLQPLLVYMASIFLLKEKTDHKKTIAFIIVLISITVAQIYSGK